MSAEEIDVFDNWGDEISGILAEDAPETPPAPDAPVPEAVSATVETPPATEPPDPSIDRGDGRNSRGEWVSKTQKEPEADAPVTTATTQATASVATPTVAGAPPAPEVASEPFVAKFNNVEYEIAGSKVTAEGVFIPKDQQELVHKYIGNGLKYQTEVNAIKAEKSAARELTRKLQLDEKAAQVKYAKYEATFKDILQIAQIKDDQSFVDNLIEYGAGLRQNLPTLMEKMKLDEERAEFDRQRAMGQPDPQDEADNFQQSVPSTVQHFLGQLKSTPEFSVLSDQDVTRLIDSVGTNPAMVFNRAGQQLTQLEYQNNIRPGEIYLNIDRLAQLARPYVYAQATVAEERKRAQELVRQAQKVADENAKRLAQASPVAPMKSGKPDEPARKPKAPIPEDKDDIMAMIAEETRRILAENA